MSVSAVYRVRFKERGMWAVGVYRCRDTLCYLMLSWWSTNKYITTSGQKREERTNTEHEGMADMFFPVFRKHNSKLKSAAVARFK